MTLLEQVLRDLGFEQKEEVPSVIELLRLTDCFSSLPQQGSSLTLLEALVSTTQKKWIRPKGTERTEQKDTEDYQKNRTAFFRHFAPLNLFAEIKPTKQEYDAVAILGAFTFRMEKRLDHLLKLWDQGVRFKKIYLLCGERPLREAEEKNVIEQLGSKATEMDAMKHLLKQASKGWPKELQQLPIIEIFAEKLQGQSRATTEDTVKAFAEKGITFDQLLVISNQPYVRYQGDVTRIKLQTLKTELTPETVGTATNPEEELISPLLDTLARRFYAGKSLLTKRYEAMASSSRPFSSPAETSLAKKTAAAPAEQPTNTNI